jgi:hypothetical protein
MVTATCRGRLSSYPLIAGAVILVGFAYTYKLAAVVVAEEGD